MRAELDEGEPVHDWREFAGTVVMGGPMGAYEEDAHPWLAEEKRLSRDGAEDGHSIWGVCLGAQLLASVMATTLGFGARARPGGGAEEAVGSGGNLAAPRRSTWAASGCR